MILSFFPVTAAILALAPASSRAFSWYAKTPSNQFTSFESTLLVPQEYPNIVPSVDKTNEYVIYFLWPGLQPPGPGDGHNYYPIDNGVLQPVLTYGGPSCAPNQVDPAHSFDSWWISAQYVNTIGNYPNYMGCKGGPAMLVAPGDRLRTTITLQNPANSDTSSIWVQTVTNIGKACTNGGTDTPAGCQVSYTIDLLGQYQRMALFIVELFDYHNHINDFDTVFEDIKLTTALAEPAEASARDVCNLSNLKGATCEGATLSTDRKTCTVKRCTLGKTEVPSFSHGNDGVISWISGCDWTGGDFKNVSGRPSESCGALCLAEGSKCRKFSWSDFNGGTCWLKDGTAKIANKQGATCGVSFTSLQWQSGNDGAVLWKYDCDWNGADIANVSNKAGSECGGLCLAQSGCRKFTWTSYNGGTCWLKGDPKYITVNKGAVCGMIV